MRRCADDGVTAADQHCQETFAWGLRNPFRIAMDPNASGTRFFINDVGQGEREEVNEGAAGADYGWNCREGTRVNDTRGTCDPTPPNMVDPVFEYNHGNNGPGSPFNNCYSITAGAFVPNGIWPQEYDGAYLVADYGCGVVAALVRDGNSYTAQEFMAGLGSNSVVYMAFGPFGDTQALYYSTFESDDIRRLSYNGTPNAAPTASISATPTFGEAPLTVNFDGRGSSDPEEAALSYEWDFGDGATSSAAAPEHTYTAPGTYTTTLIVRDERSIASDPVTVRIDVGNTPPEPQIAAPDDGAPLWLASASHYAAAQAMRKRARSLASACSGKCASITTSTSTPTGAPRVAALHGSHLAPKICRRSTRATSRFAGPQRMRSVVRHDNPRTAPADRHADVRNRADGAGDHRRRWNQRQHHHRASGGALMAGLSAPTRCTGRPDTRRRADAVLPLEP
ncbi:PKD domain-containing protein [Candidatus Gracilibacteria bacterium]|nr:PKD domain-containing protein [Candidatus Gracilibacteria bacterium]